MIHATTWKGLKGIKLSEISKSQKDMLIMWYLNLCMSPVNSRIVFRGWHEGVKHL